ncbi:hypothetical protein COV53_01810, partial [Candidatus Gottesmanbacteria bacterium CG11_big_fil_rev_8_21_14_0_20_37_11]
MKIFLYFLSFVSTITVSVFIYIDKYSPLLIYWWGASIIFLILSALLDKKIKIKHLSHFLSKKNLFILLIVLLPILVRVGNYNLNRIHGDDALTAYFSATEHFSKINFFSGIPSDKAQWQSQFPTLFFVFQRIFFIIFGESFLTMKLSLLPYILIISITLFLLTKIYIGGNTAIISVILYAFFSISLYYETLGLIFVSSTAVFILFFYLAIRYLSNFKTPLVLIGILCGACYLFYLTSYIALPVMLLIFFIKLVRVKKIIVIRDFLIVLLSFLVVLAPFLTYAYRFDNYFTSRTNQVSLLSGSWSSGKERIAKGEKPINIIKENAINTIKCFYIDDIGGGGGYDFAHQAIFEKTALFLFIIGCILVFVFSFRKVEYFLLFLVVFLSYLEMALSMPPIGYQRFILAFPFITIIMSLPFSLVISFNKTSHSLRCIVVVIMLGLYVINNQRYFLKSVEKEKDNNDLKLSKYINQNFPGRRIHIASYPGFGYDKVYYFSQGKNALSVDTAYHDYYLHNFNTQEKYVYVIIFPNDFNSKFAALDN